MHSVNYLRRFGSSLYPYADASPGTVRRVGLMAVVNLTPDSFYDGGRYLDSDIALERCRRCIDEGADMLDLGAESTRPGAKGVDAVVQIDRLRPIVRAVRKFTDIAVSIDTSEPEVMHALLGEGADMINDVCALEKAGALDVVRRHQCAVCLMHKQGIPASMQNNPCYDNVVNRVKRYLYARVVACLEAGLTPESLAIDPGFGFGKNFTHNYALLAGLRALRFAGLPLVVGLSRKSMIGQSLDAHGQAESQESVQNRLEGSLIAGAYAVWQGANIVRTHDVAPMRRALAAAQTIAHFHGSR